MDFSSLAFTGSTVASVIIGLALVVAAIIIVMKQRYKNMNPEDLAAKESAGASKDFISDRRKYAGVNPFSMRGTFLNMGLAFSLLIIIFAFNWTEYEEEIFIPDNALELEEEIIMEPPRTAEPPPPPPPPPPPVIEEVPDEEILEEEEPEFVDNSVSEESVIEDAPVEEAAPPPPPPPPPPPKVEEIFKVVEDMPRFPGCESESDKATRDKCAQKKMLEYIYKNIKYPAIARENGVEGTVVVTFIVEKSGKITDAKIIRDIGAQCGDEALKIVNKMPTWIPGKQRGRNVRVQFNLPVKFRLE